MTPITELESAFDACDYRLILSTAQSMVARDVADCEVDKMFDLLRWLPPSSGISYEQGKDRTVGVFTFNDGSRAWFAGGVITITGAPCDGCGDAGADLDDAALCRPCRQTARVGL